VTFVTDPLLYRLSLDGFAQRRKEIMKNKIGDQRKSAIVPIQPRKGTLERDGHGRASRVARQSFRDHMVS
jgi:predicted RNase H-like nuclease